MIDKTQNQPQRPRSPHFPFVPLRKALEFTQIIHQEFGEEPVGAPRALKAMGYDASSGKAHRVLAALKAYGLITREQDDNRRIRVSPSGATLAVSPKDANMKTLRLAALEPRRFRRIWQNRPGITEQELANFLEQRNFTEEGARRAARVYTANVRFAKLEDPAFRKSDDVPLRPDGSGKAKGAGAEIVRAPKNPEAPQRLRIPLHNDFASIPVRLSPEDFRLLMQTLRLWKSRIISA